MTASYCWSNKFQAKNHCWLCHLIKRNDSMQLLHLTIFLGKKSLSLWFLTTKEHGILHCLTNSHIHQFIRPPEILTAKLNVQFLIKFLVYTSATRRLAGMPKMCIIKLLLVETKVLDDARDLKSNAANYVIRVWSCGCRYLIVGEAFETFKSTWIHVGKCVPCWSIGHPRSQCILSTDKINSQAFRLGNLMPIKYKTLATGMWRNHRRWSRPKHLLLVVQQHRQSWALSKCMFIDMYRTPPLSERVFVSIHVSRQRSR